MTDLGQPARSVMQNKYLYLMRKTIWWSEYILSNIVSILMYYLFLPRIFTIGENDSFQQKFRQKFWIPSTSLNNEVISANLLKMVAYMGEIVKLVVSHPFERRVYFAHF